jgi:hypothetical protein
MHARLRCVHCNCFSRIQCDNDGPKVAASVSNISKCRSARCNNGRSFTQQPQVYESSVHGRRAGRRNITRLPKYSAKDDLEKTKGGMQAGKNYYLSPPNAWRTSCLMGSWSVARNALDVGPRRRSSLAVKTCPVTAPKILRLNRLPAVARNCATEKSKSQIGQ